MKLKIRYENEYETLEVETMEAGKWLNISISEEESQEDFEKRIQQAVEKEYNRPDYNSWHKFDRHRGYTYAKGVNEDGEECDTSEPLMKEVADTRIFLKDEIERHLKYEYEDCCKKIRQALKPVYAEMVIAIVLDEVSISDYAASIGDSSNNVSHRYRRAIKKLKGIFTKTSF